MKEGMFDINQGELTAGNAALLDVPMDGVALGKGPTDLEAN